MTQFALKWILMHKQISTVITGAKTASQIRENANSSQKPDLDEETMMKVKELYEEKIKAMVHQYW